MSKHVVLLSTKKQSSYVTINLRPQRECATLKLHQLTILPLIVYRH